MNTKIKIGVLGVGAIGTVIGYQLQRQKTNALSYFSRTEKNHLKLISNGTSFDIPIAIQTSIIEPLELDWLIICLKEHQYQEARHWFSKLIRSKTKIAVIRNGLQLKKPLLEFTTEEQVLECIIDCPTELNENGYYKTINTPLITVSKNELATAFSSLFLTSDIEICQVLDFKTESWKKLCESATLGALLCLNKDTCRIFKNDNKQQQYKDLMNESIQVAKADGAIIEDDFTDKMFAKLMRYPETKGSSMLTDMRSGKPIELRAKNGIISQLGEHYKIATPINDLIVKLLS